MIEAVRQAGQLIRTLDPNLLECVRTSLFCSLTATAAAVFVGVPIAVLLGRRNFRGRGVLVVAAHTGMAVPTVVIGLLLYGLLSSTGPLGELAILYTRRAIIIGEFALALPIIVALFSSATASLEPKMEMTARTLGAGRLRIFWTVICEARVALIAVTMAAFGRICSELGIAMMVGGNIKYYTRTMTTAIALETAGGDFALALALGLILVLIALGINVAAQIFSLPSPRRYPDVFPVS
ncbi:MAG: ABC transporter permease subunit [Actinobacteria bacterium]|nr:ABC transporter permease subunit [Actinomycetota bacterium]